MLHFRRIRHFDNLGQVMVCDGNVPLEIKAAEKQLVPMTPGNVIDTGYTEKQAPRAAVLVALGACFVVGAVSTPHCARSLRGHGLGSSR
jgi:hypothetical protein